MGNQPHSTGKNGLTCEHCGKTGPGANHTIWYGKSLRKSQDALSRTYQISVGGSRVAWICQRCKWKAVLLHPQFWLLAFTPFFVYYSLQLRYVTVPFNQFLPWTIALYVFYYFTAAHSRYHVFEFWFGAGSRMAKKVHKKVLENQGYHLFWTPGQYEKMMSRK